MAKTITPQRIAWTPAYRERFQKAGFTPRILDELTTLGALYTIDELLIVARLEAFESGVEVVWMASLGRGLAKHARTFFEGAKRRGALAIRFHIDDDEKALVRLLSAWQPRRVDDEDFDGLVYRVMIQEAL